MTPLEKALQTQQEIDYCDQCEHVRIVNHVGYCGISGKLLHPRKAQIRAITFSGTVRSESMKKRKKQNDRLF